jgi:acyl carrier protein
MTDTELITQRLCAVLSAEADDFDVEKIQLATQLRKDLNLSGAQRIGAAFAIQKEFGIDMDDASFDSIVVPGATVADCLAAVLRQLPTTTRAGAIPG